MAHLLDANVLISAKNLYYGFDFCPGFWDWILRSHDLGLVRSVEKVGDEVRAVDDDLSEWAKLRGPAFFAPPEAADLPALKTVSDWTRQQDYEATAINLSPVRGLLLGRPGPRRSPHGRHPRSALRESEEDQDPQCLHRVADQVHHTLRHSALGRSAIRARRRRRGETDHGPGESVSETLALRVG